ncbi:MAG TPA: hypothetical protein VMV26_04375 [Alphaproteobacteria bacterium]|nr:hypothetical protein [Alphaproteobacteria bacterium]
MALNIETFSNVRGGNSFFKALGHPLAVAPARALLARLGTAGPVAVYDPLGLFASCAELYPFATLALAGVYVQNVGDLGRTVLGRTTQPVTDLKDARAKSVLVIAFDAQRLIAHIRHLVPAGAEIVSLDALRLPEAMLTNRERYLDPLNFATNFAYFRDRDGHHSRIVTANYWSGYGAKAVTLWLRLFGDDGAVLAEWTEALSDAVGSVVIDSRAVRERFGLGDFTGQLFIHAIGVRGHDVVKYALDTYGDAPHVLSCTHDANAWPSDLYAGLPAPRAGERVVLWVQNSHPCPIPRNGVGLNLMGRPEIAWLDEEIAPFASRAVDVATLLPAAAWPQQIEVQAGKHFVRPRYEVIDAKGRQRIAHANVERVDLKPDPHIPELANLMGKGYLLPAPILPLERFRSAVLPTPMATTQTDLPIAVLVHDASGREMARHRFGRLARADSVALAVDELAAQAGLPSGYGHMELVYDFADGGGADGWLHGLFRYEDRKSGHVAETSFGAHIFNTVLTYRNEPQSYAGAAPGLSTRLFLRLGHKGHDTLCHLIYPASTPWHGVSETDLVLHDGDGREVARRHVRIPCSGSRLWRYGETFDAAERRAAGDRPYVVVRDVTCRLFGYHGLLNDGQAFSFDHMFGF